MTAATLHVYQVEGNEDDPGSELVVAHSFLEALSMGANYATAGLALGGAKVDEAWVLAPLPIPEGVTEPTALVWGDPKWDRYYRDHDWGALEDGHVIVCGRCSLGDFASIPESRICQRCDWCAGCVAEASEGPCEECGP